MLFRSNNNKPETGVQLMKVDDFLTQENIEFVDLLKMNIEGGEYELIPFIKKILVKNHPNVYLSLHPFLLKGFLNKTLNNIKLFYSLRGYKYIYRVKKNSIFESNTLKILINLRFPIVKNIKDPLIFTNKKFF